jgi:ribosome-associated protein
VTHGNVLSDSDIVEISRRCARVLEEKKGTDIVIMDLRGVNGYLDYFLITTGNSRVHCRALARELERFVNTQDLSQRNKPDYESGWIILDFNELIVHIFTQEMREYYQLEKLWGDAKKISYNNINEKRHP